MTKRAVPVRAALVGSAEEEQRSQEDVPDEDRIERAHDAGQRFVNGSFTLSTTTP